LQFTRYRFIFFIACSALGFLRASFYVVNVPYKSGDFIVLTLKSCKPQPVNYGRNIYGYASTREIGKVGIIWPNKIKFPSTESIALGIWKPFEEKKLGSFDVKEYYESLGCNGVFTPIESLSLDSNIPISSTYRLTMINNLVGAGVEKHALGFMLGLSTGDKSLLSRKAKDMFARAGLSHLLAVSGYHVGLVGFIPLLFLRSRRREIKYLSGFGLAGIWTFIIACGSPWSAIRSGIMLTVAIAGKWASQSVLPWQALCVAAWIVAWIDPYAPQQLGTQLSFAATAGILSVVSKPKWLILRIPIAAQTATLAWLALAFQKVPILFLPLNVIASVIVTFIGAIIGLGSFAISIDPMLGNAILNFGGLITGGSIQALEWLDKSTHLEMSVDSVEHFISASLSGVAWLLKDTIPFMLSRLISATAILFLVFNLLS
jgi:ComEC/Rec2-related protein